MRNNTITRLLGMLILGILFTLNSCIKEPPKPSGNGNPNNYKGTRVVVLCEGNYLWNNASMDVFLPDSQKVYNNVFEAANGTDLGDVLQSALLLNGKLNLVVNNSGKIVQVNSSTFKVTQSNSGFVSPRYLASAKGKLFVSDIKSPYIVILDSQTLQKVGSVQIPDQVVSGESYWTEQMVASDSLVFVALESGKMMVINAISQQREFVNAEPGSTQICMDEQKRIWLLCSQNGKSFLMQYNSQSKMLEQRIPILPQLSNSSASKMALSKSQDKMYLLVNGKLYALTISSNTDPQSIYSIAVAGLKNAYGLNVNPFNGDIYIADAVDYVSNGKVMVLDNAEKMKSQFTTGVIPTDFVFLKE
jgi:hypothetical protein